MSCDAGACVLRARGFKDSCLIGALMGVLATALVVGVDWVLESWGFDSVLLVRLASGVLTTGAGVCVCSFFRNGGGDISRFMRNPFSDLLSEDALDCREGEPSCNSELSCFEEARDPGFTFSSVSLRRLRASS